MPLQLNEVDMQVEVEAPSGEQATPRTTAPAEAWPRWQELASRDAQISARTAAWGFDD